jgi:hypothetical protein
METNKGILPGFVYGYEIYDKHMNLTDKGEDHNLIPVQGLQRVASLLLGLGAAPVDEWFLGLLDSGYTVNAAATLQGACAKENTSYTSADVRIPCDLVYDDAFGISNSASLAEFVFVDAATIYGAFLTDLETQAAYASGVLLSVANFATPKVITAGGLLRLTAGITLSTT